MSYEPLHQSAMSYHYRPSYDPRAYYNAPEAIGRGILQPQTRSPESSANLYDEKVGIMSLFKQFTSYGMCIIVTGVTSWICI